MLDFLRLGGVASWFVLLFGLITLGSAIRFAFKPDESQVGALKALSLSTLFSLLAGMVAGFVAVCLKVPSNPEWASSPDLPLIVLTGFGEAMTNGIIGFTLLSLTWLVASLGFRRMRI